MDENTEREVQQLIAIIRFCFTQVNSSYNDCHLCKWSVVLHYVCFPYKFCRSSDNSFFVCVEGINMHSVFLTKILGTIYYYCYCCCYQRPWICLCYSLLLLSLLLLLLLQHTRTRAHTKHSYRFQNVIRYRKTKQKQKQITCTHTHTKKKKKKERKKVGTSKRFAFII